MSTVISIDDRVEIFKNNGYIKNAHAHSTQTAMLLLKLHYLIINYNNEENNLDLFKSTKIKDLELEVEDFNFIDNDEFIIVINKLSDILLLVDEAYDYINNLTVEEFEKIYLYIPFSRSYYENSELFIKICDYYLHKDFSELPVIEKDKIISYLNSCPNLTQVESLSTLLVAYEEIAYNMDNNISNTDYIETCRLPTALTELMYEYFEKVDLNDVTNNIYQYYTHLTMCSCFKDMDNNVTIFIIYYLLDNFDALRVFEILEKINETSQKLSLLQWINLIDNYDEYKELPASWWLELV